MFYETAKNDHGLPRDPFKAIVVPRPIGWITSVSHKGEINLAPYSFFNAVSEDPPMVMFSSGGRKDSISFIEETKEFVCNFASFDLREAMSTTGTEFPRGVNEMVEAGLAPATASSRTAGSIPPPCSRSHAAATTTTPSWTGSSPWSGRGCRADRRNPRPRNS
jgi:flavin reductase (DIM6/NTAB) family NADH-FMN oxidoreductase RutF